MACVSARDDGGRTKDNIELLTRRPVFLALIHAIFVGSHRGRLDGVPINRVELMIKGKV